MELLAIDQLIALAAESDTTCVSIYTPMEQPGTKTLQNPIRFKNARFHGHGAGKDNHKDSLLRYVRKVSNGLQSYFSQQKAPLILAELFHQMFQ